MSIFKRHKYGNSIIHVLWLICITILIHNFYGNVKSQTGNIIIDSDADGISNLKINTTGLAIGDNLTPASNLHVTGNILATTGITIGDNVAGASTLNIGGSLGMQNTTITSNVTLDTYGLNLVDSTAGSITINLPDVVSAAGRVYTVKKLVASNSVTVEGSGNNIDTSSAYTLGSGNTAYITVISSGNTWYIIDKSSLGINAGGGVVAEENLVGWWKFDETSGTNVPDELGANNGTMYNMNNSDWVAGKIGNGLQFDGGNDYVQLPSLTFRSLAMWVYIPSGQSGWNYMYDARNGNSNGYFAMNSGSNAHGTIWTTMYVNGSSVSVGYTSIPLNTWSHVYIESNVNVTDDVTMAARVSLNENLAYTIDELTFYDRVLTADEIQELYEQGL